MTLSSFQISDRFYNQLLKVSDSGNGEGFKEGTNIGNVYLYDLNGNMVSDLNKGISNIAYNHLKLPEVITKTDGVIKYIYNATLASARL